MNHQTPLAKVIGLGSAKSGTYHFWMQRITAIALIPLSFWMVAFTEQLLNSSYQQIIAWLSSPMHSILSITWVIVTFYHAALGLQEVLKDYIHLEWLKITSILLLKLIFFFATIATIIAIFRLLII